MKEIAYKTFSLKTHQKNLHFDKPSVCQFELTFRCPLHCRHCYTDCYNQAAYFKKELNTKQAKIILDKIHKAGVLWLCLTGGDPLARSDFSKIYLYAKEKGFMVTLFTSGFYLGPETIGVLKKSPPFVVEITLNAVSEELYEKIAQTKGSFSRVMKGIHLLLENRIPLKLKTMVTKDNFAQLPKIEEFVKRLGLEFQPDPIINPRLSGDITPCDLRVPPEELFALNKETREREGGQESRRCENPFYPCAIDGGSGFFVDPQGNLISCCLNRYHKINLLEIDVELAREESLSALRSKKFLRQAPCKSCELLSSCFWCPSRAYLEKADSEAPIEYYCRLAELNSHANRETVIS